MLIDNYGRTIDYLRISVTDKCNYRCTYCMPEEGVELKSHDEILSFEAIRGIASCAFGLGIRKIRLTGGEPMVRKDIGRLVGMLRGAARFDEINMTSNGSLLSLDNARMLKRQGLTRLNISLDTLDAERFSRITRGGDIKDVFAGIDAALEAGFDPVKINMIVFRETSEGEIESMRSFCDGKRLLLQTIKHFELYDSPPEKVQVNSIDRPKPCNLCDRLRLTADGYLKPCLFSEKEIRVDMDDIEGSIRKAVGAKPLKGTCCLNRTMCQIGG